MIALAGCTYDPRPGSSAPSPTDGPPIDTCAGSGTETCNGADDDCDGMTDEGFGVGMPCDGADADSCNEGVTECGGSCSDATADAVEACAGAVDEDCNGATDCGDMPCVATPFCCVGSADGPVHTIGNTCVVDDFGTSGSSDNLEVYCCGGQARFCLSKEACPWRGGACPPGLTKTCSRAGLPGTMMATANCSLWKGQTSYSCSADEQITFP